MESIKLTTKTASRSEALAAMKSQFKSSAKVTAFYNSLIDMIIEDEDLMAIPLEDRQFHRGHAVFDTTKVVNGRVVLLEEHLQRFQRSAKMARIQFPFSIDVVRQKILETCYYAYQKNMNTVKQKQLNVRFWLSAGLGGGFGITPGKSAPIFYCVVYLAGNGYSDNLWNGIKDFTIREYPMKTGILVNAKTNNYLINALVAMKAAELGGQYGVQVDARGYITEGCAANCMFLWDNGDVVTPRWDDILRGTTAFRVLELIEQHMISTGKVKKIIYRDIRPEEVYEHAREMVICTYDMIVPVLEFDGRKIGDGKKGAWVTELQKMFIKLCEEESPHINTLLQNKKQTQDIVYVNPAASGKMTIMKPKL